VLLPDIERPGSAEHEDPLGLIGGVDGQPAL